MEKLMRFFKKRFIQLLKLIKVNATPTKIALGIAIAIFWNFLPVIGLGSVLSFSVAKLVKGSEIVAVTFHLGTGFLIPVFYALNFMTGRLLLGGRELDFLSPLISVLNSLGQMASQIISTSAAQILVSVSYDFLIGSVFNSILAFAAAYLITKIILRYFRFGIYSS